MKVAAFVRSGAIYGIANVISAGVPFLLLPILTRALQPSEYGEVVTFFMLMALCAASAGLGLHAAVGVRWLDSSRGDPHSYTASAVMLVFVTTSITAVLVAVVAPLLALELSPGLCSLAAIAAGANVVQSMRFAIWQSLGQPFQAARLQVVAAATNMALSLIGVFLLHLGGAGRIYGATAASLSVALVCAYSMFSSRTATQPSRGDVRGLLRFGLPLMPHVLAGAVLTNADRFAVAGQMNSATLGVYGAASQLGLVMTVIADAAVKAYTPIMYGMLRNNSPRSKLRVVAITYLSAPLWLLSALVIWGFYGLAGPLLLGHDYLEAAGLAIWFLLGGAVNGVYLNIAGLFFFTGRTEWISAATLTASAVAILLAASAVSRFGVVGGGVTYLVVHIVLCATAWTLSRWTTPMPWGRPLLAGRVLFGSLARQR